ncbi:enoyl-CoA hydratase/isomerase family protein [Amycolatopsis acidiphila]|uniref:enoyl-CoA hydratase/isomerase family protein n=1 Tax=Amycolatopsis acidiphila TaxID=715473 RepID=UPI00164383CF|nr:enoyl-CoA hydratase/isomerase family protein [Amycolatopsis acidiphila]UIJ61136.1 enoyl-CoA hydratase/isomerase family protein [Amycolatopsis acidiphila]GHG86501.1 enoyl-CoA hydratase [Amycolatopsis acidiphila]
MRAAHEAIARVDVSHEGRVAVVTLSNPPVGAFSLELIRALHEAVTLLAQQHPPAVVFRSGIARYFGAGADLAVVRGASPADFRAYVEAVRGAVEAVAGLPCVTLAAIDGMALGGGLELALACDLRFASSRSRLGLPEVRLGLLPGAGGTQRLTRLIGRTTAIEIMLSGRQVEAAEAAALGLVTRIADPADSAAIEWASRYCENSTRAGEAIIRCVEAAGSDPALGAAQELEEIVALFAGDEATKRIRRFFERRD